MKIDNNLFRVGIIASIAIATLILSNCAFGGAQQNVVSKGTSGRERISAKSNGIDPDKHGSLFEIPDTALVRPLGKIAPAPCSSNVSQVCVGAKPTMLETLKGGYPMSIAGLGIPLGGIGAGSFMINQAGTFGPWNFGGGADERWEVRVVPQAAFHIREQVGDGQATIKTLPAGGPQGEGNKGPIEGRSWGGLLSAWHALGSGEGQYAALYPFGWIDYTPFQTSISLRFFSPIVAREDRRSSLPMAYFDLRLVNRTAKLTRISAMFTMPNASPHEGRTPSTVRSGLSSTSFSDDSLGIKGVTLSSDGIDNTPDSKISEWTIAARPPAGAEFSYTTSWNGSGDGSDIYRAFETNGNLSNSELDQSHSAAAISVSVELQPGQEVTIPFVLSWDFPQVSFVDNKIVYMRRYTNFYGGKETALNDYIQGSYPFRQSKAIALDALNDHDRNLAAVESWWKPIATDNAYPKILRTAALNQLYQVVFNNSFWEGGLVSSSLQPSLGKRAGISKPGLHLFATADSGAGQNFGNSLDVNSYNYLPYNQLFPNLERDRLIAFSEALQLAPHYTDIGVDMGGGPFFKFKDLPECSPGQDNFIDIPNEFIARSYAYAHFNHDDEFLARVYPAMSKAFHCLESEIPAGHHLPTVARMGSLEGSQSDSVDKRPHTLDLSKMGQMKFPNTFNTIFTNGPDTYNSKLYLLSLEIMIEASRHAGVSGADTSSLSHELAEAKAEFEETFWDPKQGFYAYTMSPGAGQNTVLLNTFFAQHIAERLQLPDLINTKRYQQQLTGTYSAFMQWRDPEGHLVGAPNLLAGKGVKEWPMLGVIGSVEEEGVWVGVNDFVASTYVAAGRRFRDETLIHDGIEMGSAVSAQTWLNEKTGYAFNTPMGWDRRDVTWYVYPAYERELAIWDLMDRFFVRNS